MSAMRTIKMAAVPLAPRPSNNIANQPGLPSSNVTVPSPLITTSKEWVIPPRLKPGRKAAAQDTPDKRKSQNRDAQRAFRERKAAKVGDLEEQMKLLEAGYDEERNEHQRTVYSLEVALTQYQQHAEYWKSHHRRLEQELAISQQGRSTGAPRTGQPVPTRPQHTEQHPPPLLHAPSSPDFADLRCISCTDDKCACLESFTMAETASTSQSLSLKRAGSPLDGHRPVPIPPPQATTSYEMETDFTAIFSSRRSGSAQTRPTQVAVHETSPFNSPAEEGGCGFCSDGTYCACADAAQAEFTSFNLPSQAPAFTPPQSEGGQSPRSSLSTSQQPKPTRPRTNPCENGPGTCAQCRSDPRSTLFCKSLAAKNGIHGPSPLRSCGGADEGGSATGPILASCCKSKSSSSAQSTRQQQQQQQPMGSTQTKLSCADTFTTLERHPHFDRALQDQDAWLQDLEPTEGEAADWRTGKAPLEINAVNVLAVIGVFNRRYGE